MKNISILIIVLLTSVLAFAFNQNGIVENIESAIKTGNATAIKGYCNNTIDLVVPGNEGTYSKTQAEQILKQFFTSNKPATYVHKQQGSSQGGSIFVIGNLKTTNNKEFRIYFLLKKNGDGFVIQQLQFEEE